MKLCLCRKYVDVVCHSRHIWRSQPRRGYILMLVECKHPSGVILVSGEARMQCNGGSGWHIGPKLHVYDTMAILNFLYRHLIYIKSIDHMQLIGSILF